MTNREKILAIILVVVAVVVGGGFLFHLFVAEPVSTVRTQLATALEQLQTRKNELAQEEQKIAGILRVDPRLSNWQKISLPPRDPGPKKPGVTLEDQKKKHLQSMQVEYVVWLSDLMRASGFRDDSIKVNARPVNRPSTTVAANQQAKPKDAFERLTFGVNGRGTMDSVVRMMRSFHRTPLLHQVRNLSMSVAAERGGAPGRRNTPGDLDVGLTVEALLVSGAEDRKALLPEVQYEPRVLAPGRDYAKMAKRNMFTGIALSTEEDDSPPPVVTEDRKEVLRFVKLTSIWTDKEERSDSSARERRRRWEATLYDQAKGGPEKKLNMRTREDFTIYDKDENEILKGTVVHMDEKQVIFKSGGKFYRLQCGDFLYPAVDLALPTKEVKALGIEATD